MRTPLTTTCRILLLGRAALAAGVAVAAVGGVAATAHLAPAAGLVAVVSAGQAVAVTRRPALPRRPAGMFALLAVDVVMLLGVLAWAGPGWFFAGCAGGLAMLAGLLLGFVAAPIWVGQLLQMYAVSHAPAPVLAVPVVAGVAAAVLRSVLDGHARRTAAELSAAQREAAALERARLARELHDSVAKTVHGMSLAAMALPGSLGRHPHLAIELADAISTAAAVAERETRDLLAGMRLDSPDENFRHTLERLCELWSGTSGIPVSHAIAAAEPPVAVRYELVRILQEALTNIGRHARAARVSVTLRSERGWLGLVVADDGIGFRVPRDLATLTSHHHHGLVGMAERARAVGGRLDVAAQPGRGTAITVRLPT